MEVQDLKKISNAPTEGVLLAYLREKVIFEKYNSIEEVVQKFSGKTLLEIHMFNQDKEYRAIKSTSRRFPDGVIEDVVDFPYSEGAIDCFKTDGLSDKSFREGISEISVLNHLSYDENGTISVDNFRLIGEV